MQAEAGLQLGPDALRRIYVRSQTNAMVLLNKLVTLHSTTAPLSVNDQGQFPFVMLNSNLRAGVPLGHAVDTVQSAVGALRLPQTLQASFQGNAQAFQSSLSVTPPLILAALIAVYVIPGMLYESQILPLTILSTLPSTGIGALLMLQGFGFGPNVIGSSASFCRSVLSKRTRLC